MGRRDEPELEELSKLLRRLETIEVAPKQESARKPEPAPQAEYVGALRGAAPAQVEPRKSSSPEAARTGSRAAPPGRKAPSTSTTAIVIGAATAAVVSSIVAAVMVVWTSDGKRSEDAPRLTFYAPKERSGAAPVAAADAGAPASAVDAQPLLQRADAYLRAGKPDEARQVLEQAARAGSGVAALTLGAMYDPGRIAQFAKLGIKADPAVARVWYERAKDLGVAEANERLAELAAK